MHFKKHIPYVWYMMLRWICMIHDVKVMNVKNSTLTDDKIVLVECSLYSLVIWECKVKGKAFVKTDQGKTRHG